jgi:hypothetical protein
MAAKDSAIDLGSCFAKAGFPTVPPRFSSSIRESSRTRTSTTTEVCAIAAEQQPRITANIVTTSTYFRNKFVMAFYKQAYREARQILK